MNSRPNPREHGGAEGLTHLRPRAGRDHQRQDAQDEGKRRHQDRAQPGLRGGDGGVETGQALFLGLFGEFHDQDCVFRGKADQHHQPDFDQDVAVEGADVHADHRRQDAHRHDHDDGERQQPAFVHRRQQQEDEAGRQAFGGQFLDRGDALAAGKAGFQGELHFRRRIQVVARDTERAGRVAEGGDGADRDHIAGGIAGFQIGDIARGQPERIVGLRRYAIGTAEQVEVVDIG